MTRLSVNINKIATIRNARGGDTPNVVLAAVNCERFGAEGITVHPRPDERHITKQDVFDLKKVVKTEFNIEGFPSEAFLNMVLEISPTQVTLVPDPPDVLTSSDGWDTKKQLTFLKRIIKQLKDNDIRTSLFLDPDAELVKYAAETGTDRIEFYTGPYAEKFHENRELAVKPYVKSANLAQEFGLGINAGHDLSLENLKYFNQMMPFLDEVSIGHALISDALYFGLDNTIKLYLKELDNY